MAAPANAMAGAAATKWDDYSMYESFFNFQRRPFSSAPDLDQYIALGSMRTADDALTRMIQRRQGIGLIIGGAGTGKTLLAMALAERFADSMQTAMLSSGRLVTRRALLQAILFELGLAYKDLPEGELRLSLNEFLTTHESCASGFLLVVDEAHGLPYRLLEELRILTNLTRNGQPCVQLVLAGNPRLEERFTSPKLESLNQRVQTRCYLDPLHRDDTLAYVRHQLGNAGVFPDQVFPEESLHAIYRATDGIPRLINQIADHALVLAATGGQTTIGPEGIAEAWADLQQLPAPWPGPRSATAVEDGEDSVIEFGSLDDEPIATIEFDATEETEEASEATAGTAEECIQDRPAECAADDACGEETGKTIGGEPAADNQSPKELTEELPEELTEEPSAEPSDEKIAPEPVAMGAVVEFGGGDPDAQFHEIEEQIAQFDDNQPAQGEAIELTEQVALEAKQPVARESADTPPADDDGELDPFGDDFEEEEVVDHQELPHKTVEQAPVQSGLSAPDAQSTCTEPATDEPQTEELGVLDDVDDVDPVHAEVASDEEASTFEASAVPADETTAAAEDPDGVEEPASVPFKPVASGQDDRYEETVAESCCEETCEETCDADREEGREDFFAAGVHAVSAAELRAMESEDDRDLIDVQGGEARFSNGRPAAGERSRRQYRRLFAGLRKRNA